MANKKLLTETLAFIEEHPDRWDQGEWREPLRDAEGNEYVPEDDPWCGTACCFAGWAAVLDGAECVPAEVNTYSYEWNGKIVTETEVKAPPYVIDPTSGERVHVENYAVDALGIELGEANVLFEGTNTLDDLRRYVGNLVAGRGIYDVDPDEATDEYVDQD